MCRGPLQPAARYIDMSRGTSAAVPIATDDAGRLPFLNLEAAFRSPLRFRLPKSLKVERDLPVVADGQQNNRALDARIQKQVAGHDVFAQFADSVQALQLYGQRLRSIRNLDRVHGPLEEVASHGREMLEVRQDGVGQLAQQGLEGQRFIGFGQEALDLFEVALEVGGELDGLTCWHGPAPWLAGCLGGAATCEPGQNSLGVLHPASRNV